MISEFVEKHDKLVHRILEIIPGFLTWSFILSPIWLGLLFPASVIYMLSFLALYWVYLAFRHTIGLLIGYPRYVKEMKTDWLEECRKLDFSQLGDKETLPQSLDQVKHLILMPAVNEPKEVLEEPINAFLSQNYPLNQITLVYTIEERFAEQTTQVIYELLGDRRAEFDNILIYTHPAGIPGEAIGAGAANRTWGARHAVKDLRDKGENLRNYIFTTFDADHVPNRQYISRLTHLYLTTDRRDHKFYATALHLYDNNHWNVHPMMRIESNFVTLGTLANRSLPWGTGFLTRDTFAAYSTSLQTLIDADYWDVALGVDDTIFYWKAFFVRNGEFKVRTHYIPYSADAVEGKNFWSAHKSLYKQLLRWGWGVIEVPYSVKRFLTKKNIPTSAKLVWLYDHFKTRVLLVNTVFLITFGFAILTLVNPAVKQSSFAYSLPRTMSFVLTFALLFLIPNAIYRAKIVKPMPANWPMWKKVGAVAEGFLVIVNLLTFSYIPWIDAQTRMMLGKKMKDLYHTPKLRN
jgi:hypothetical protein